MKILLILLLSLIPLAHCFWGFDKSEEELIEKKSIEENHAAVERFSTCWEWVEAKLFIFFIILVIFLVLGSTVVLVWNLSTIRDAIGHPSNLTIL